MASLRDIVTRVRFDVKTEPLEKLQGTLEKVKGRLSFLAAAELLRGLSELSERFGHFAIDLEKAAMAAGLTTDQFQKLSFAAEESGVNQAQMGKALETLAHKLYDARIGSEDAALAFARAGINPAQIRTFHNGEEALKALADSLRKIQDPIKRAAVAQNLLGDAGADMLKMLEEGSEGIEEATQKAGRLGIVVSPGHLKALASASKTLEVFKHQVTTLGIEFVARLAPALNSVVTRFGEFLAVHHRLISISFDKFTAAIAFAAGYATGIFRDLGLLFDWFVKKFPNSAKAIGIFAAAVIGLMAILGPVIVIIGLFGHAFSGLAKILKPFEWVFENALVKPLKAFLGLAGKVGTSVIRAFGKLFAYLFPQLAEWMVATTAAIAPYLAVAAAIAGIVVVSHDLWTLWKGGKFEDTWIGKALKAAKGAGSSIMSLLGFGDKEEDAKGKKPPDIKAGDTVKAGGALDSMLTNVGGIIQNSAGQVPAMLAHAPQAASDFAERMAEYAITNNITINVPSGTDPKRAADSVKDGVRDAMDSILRKAHVAGTPARSY